MAAPTPPRSDIARPTFPEYLKAGGMQMVLVEDDFASRLWKGDTILGWEGDSRLALYVSPAAGQWCLVRYGEDNEIVVLCTLPARRGTAVNAVGEFVAWLVANDSRRGHNAAIRTIVANDRRDVEAEAELTEWAQEAGARLAHHLSRQGV